MHRFVKRHRLALREPPNRLESEPMPKWQTPFPAQRGTAQTTS